MSEQKIIELQACIDRLADAVASLQSDMAIFEKVCASLQVQLVAAESTIEVLRMDAFAQIGDLQSQLSDMQIHQG